MVIDQGIRGHSMTAIWNGVFIMLGAALCSALPSAVASLPACRVNEPPPPKDPGPVAVMFAPDCVVNVVSAVSLGSTDTLIEHPAGLTHRCLTEEARQATGICGSLLRISVGLESPEDLWADLKQALEAAQAAAQPSAELAGASAR